MFYIHPSMLSLDEPAFLSLSVSAVSYTFSGECFQTPWLSSFREGCIAARADDAFPSVTRKGPTDDDLIMLRPTITFP